MDNYIEIGRQILDSQPFSRFLGARLDEFSRGSARISLPLRPEYLQQYGAAHGGVISYLADNALTFAGGSVLGPDVITSEFKINYVKKAFGESLQAVAKAASTGSRQVVCTCEIWAVKGEERVLCALAQGTIVALGYSPNKIGENLEE